MVCTCKKLLCGAAYRNIMLWVDCSIAAVLCHHNFSFSILIFFHTVSALHAYQPAFCHSARGFITWDQLWYTLLRERIAELLRYCRIMHTIHRNELPLGCNISLLFKRKLDTTLSSYAPISQLLSDYSPCLVEALLMGCNRYWSHYGVSSNVQGEPRHGRRVSTVSSGIDTL